MAECTATSARPSSTACCTSFTNMPVPPIAWIGTSVRTSPVVVTITSSASSPSSVATRSACQRASALPRVATRERAGHQSSGSASGSGRPNSSTSASAYSSPRAVPAASFRRTVGSCSSLLTMPRVSCSTASRCRRVERVELGAVPLELGGAQLVGVGAQRGDERRDLAGGAVEPVAVELLGDDLADLADLLAPLRERLLAEARGGRRCRAGSRRTPRPRRGRCCGARRCRRPAAPDRVRGLHHRLDRRCARRAGPARRWTTSSTSHATRASGTSSSVIGAAADPPGQLLGTRRGAVGDDDLAHAGARQRERHALAHLARAEHEHPPVVERPEPAGRRARPPPTTPTPRAGRSRSRCGPACRPRPRGGTCARAAARCADSCSATCHASRTWPRISPSPMIIESRPAATPKRCATAASSWYV